MRTVDMWKHFYSVSDVATIAAEIHAGPARSSNGTFTTATFLSAVAQTHYAYRPTEPEAVAVLESDPGIVRRGGWLVRPSK